LEKRVINEDLSQFLRGYFNRDTGTIDGSIREFLSESSNEYIDEVLTNIELFIAKSDISNEAKNKFIKSETSINYLALNVQPLNWLANLLYLFKTLKSQMGTGS
jgi:hypothetical protein